MSAARRSPALLLVAVLLATGACRHTDALRAPAARPDDYAAAPRPFCADGESAALRWCTSADPVTEPYAPVASSFAPAPSGPMARLAPGSVGPPAASDDDALWAHRAVEFTTPPPGAERERPPSVCDPEAWQRAVCLHRARKKSAWLAAAGIGAIMTYGLIFWDYGTNGFHFRDDGLFEKDTEYGGADKAGHCVSAGVHTAIFSALNRAFGIPRKEAALRGSLTAFAVLAMVEVGDGFTKVHGFTYGDLVGDAVGCLFGYFHESSPWFARTFDLRWEYWPTDRVWSGEDLDLSTDYEGSSYILAINVGSVVGRPQSLWNLLDFQLGYQTRHYQDQEGAPERNVLMGVGVNFSNLFRRIGWKVPATIFKYYQPPYTSLRFSIDLND